MVFSQFIQRFWDCCLLLFVGESSPFCFDNHIRNRFGAARQAVIAPNRVLQESKIPTWQPIDKQNAYFFFTDPDQRRVGIVGPQLLNFFRLGGNVDGQVPWAGAISLEIQLNVLMFGITGCELLSRNQLLTILEFHSDGSAIESVRLDGYMHRHRIPEGNEARGVHVDDGNIGKTIDGPKGNCEDFGADFRRRACCLRWR